ncbi:MAG: hypothetical protein COU28_02220, partial [Candidatus Magasanikbacteria bacterium CG10_big_fil_rev_8_21_14_0_10_36_16]
MIERGQAFDGILPGGYASGQKYGKKRYKYFLHHFLGLKSGFHKCPGYSNRKYFVIQVKALRQRQFTKFLLNYSAFSCTIRRKYGELMFEQIILGIIQGVAEWLPVSSEGMIVLIKSNFFPSTTPLAEVIIKQALFLHLGTFFAALVYFRREVGELLKALFNYRKASAETQKLFGFLFISTMISGCLGILLLKGLTEFVGQFESSTRT